jgi:riboflavin synthase
MFTGLVEAKGTITKITDLGDQARYEIAIPFASELALGDSVATNGCCLTVASLTDGTASFDLLHQTLKVTSLGALKVGSVVNLERALLPTQRLGGHFVQGHVDATGTLIDLSVHGQDHRLEISLPPEIYKYCIDKGSIAIDGISLTIAELKDGSVGVPPASTQANRSQADPSQASAVFWITPHTFQETHLHSLELGHPINLEADLLAKYTEKLLAKRT